MDWKNFKPTPEEDLASLRAVALLMEGEDPDAEIVPIKGHAPVVKFCGRCKDVITRSGFCLCNRKDA